MIICLEQGADDLHMVHLMPLPPHHLCISKIQNGFSFWYWPTQVCPRKSRLNECCCYCWWSYPLLLRARTCNLYDLLIHDITPPTVCISRWVHYVSRFGAAEVHQHKVIYRSRRNGNSVPFQGNRIERYCFPLILIIFICERQLFYCLTMMIKLYLFVYY